MCSQNRSDGHKPLSKDGVVSCKGGDLDHTLSKFVLSGVRSGDAPFPVPHEGGGAALVPVP